MSIRQTFLHRAKHRDLRRVRKPSHFPVEISRSTSILLGLAKPSIYQRKAKTVWHISRFIRIPPNRQFLQNQRQRPEERPLALLTTNLFTQNRI